MRSYVRMGYLSGTVLSILLLYFLFLPETHSLRAPGDFNTGHEDMPCMECHEEAPGSARQQIQANLQYLFGSRNDYVTFNFHTPDNKDCLACHERENDTHNVYRFNEPRFLKVRKIIQPQRCVSCHREHHGVRITADIDYCRHCHEETEIKNDPIEVPHTMLIKAGAWSTCLGCHDFHGNHEMDIPIKMDRLINVEALYTYFKGGPDPYSEKKFVDAKKVRHED